MNTVLVYLFGGITIAGLLLFAAIWLVAWIWRVLNKLDKEKDGN